MPLDFTSIKVLVVGDLMLDSYIWGDCSRVSPEAPVPVVNATKITNHLGGACNVANNLISLGATVSICGFVANDDDGKKLKSMLDALNIDTSLIFNVKDKQTTKKQRIIASHQQMLRIDFEDSTSFGDEVLDPVFSALEGVVGGFSAIILSDYGKGVLSEKFTKALIALANNLQKPILVDPKGNDYSKYKNATLITPNLKEASLATNINIDSKENLLKAIKLLDNICNLKYPLITLGEGGIAVLENDNLEIIPTQAKEVYDVTGAGDTVIASLALALSSSLPIGEACKFANAAAAVVVAKIGSATASMDEIFKTNSKTIEIKDFKNLDRSKKIVFTNGCFDILHTGHLDSLSRAKSLGDLLVVGINSDASIKRLKGPSRPINALQDRVKMLEALSVVDYVVAFSEDTPLALIEALRPDILVKGRDYEGKEVVGSEFAKEVVLLDLVEGYSTTSAIENIKNSK